ncbi:DHA2 family efflux MFS transporter permease subunit [Haliangium ochraceum]|uniref:Drug resistance transporter, EmrB/QacA subfamily n=1 Tax=Haliangium ochraceum (strain DSM 14365 / JCM 11303 / SMP-2) TaxID=502025 RepID=D0LNK3_HALO1|nr:DHA2 family efflux MFS transporter permease subunit [Haliangium ochraceum]ACY16908.1 drug resistance transporter, EmrB/QacA subfamily [Haliangium ochraceum DSM 14365]
MSPNGDSVPASGAKVLGRYPYKVMGVALLGTYLIAINTTVLGVALPAMARDFGIHGSGADWIINAYLVALAVSMPATGWLMERLGRRRAFILALSVFTVGALMSTLATEVSTLLAGRALQGLGGGPLMPLAVSSIYELFPVEQRGTVLGIWGVAVAAAPAVGPPLGGWLVTEASWRWIFAFLCAGGVIGIVAAQRALRDLIAPRRVPLDVKGWLAVTTALIALVVLARQGAAWGLNSPPSLALGALFVGASALFVRWSLRSSAPVLDVRVFGERTFSITMLLLAFFALGQYTRLNFLPIELQVVRGMSALEVGMLLTPAAVAVAVAMPLGGRLSDRYGPRLPVVAGMALLALTMSGLAFLRPDTPTWIIVALLVGQGFGAGCTFSPVQVTAMTAVHSRLNAQAAALTQLNRQISAAVGTAIMGALLVAQLGAVTPVVETARQVADAQSGFNRVFLLSALLLGAGTLVACALPGIGRIRCLQRQRTAEHEAFLADLGEVVPVPR